MKSVTRHWSAASRERRDVYRHGAVLGAITLGLLLIGKSVLAPLNAALALLPTGAPVSVDSFLVAGSAALGIARPTRDLPITLVTIDDALYAQWGRPCVTPRHELVRLIAAAAAQRPAAIVVDINLDCAETERACATGCEVDDFFRNYSGPPLILARGMYMETVPGQEPRVRTTRTAYEAGVASNSRISWAHTLYLTDADGAVRRWRHAWEACTDDGTETILGVPLRIAVALDGEGSVTQAPPRTGQCTFSSQTSPQHLLILGAPIIGNTQLASNATSPRVLPARHLLDTERAIAESGFYSLTDRVVIIGAIHGASGDIWRTPTGLMPGMELIAHTLRFSPQQLELGTGERSFSKPMTLIAFWTLATMAFALRPSLVVALAGIMAFFGIYVATNSYSRFDVFESLALSLWLFIEYAVVFAFWELFIDSGRYRGVRLLRLLLAKRLRLRDPEIKRG